MFGTKHLEVIDLQKWCFSFFYFFSCKLLTQCGIQARIRVGCKGLNRSLVQLVDCFWRQTDRAVCLCWSDGRLVCSCFWRDRGVVGVCPPERLPHSAEGRLRHAGLICSHRNTLPLILLWFCCCLCGIGALQADTLQFTHSSYTEGLQCFGYSPADVGISLQRGLFQLVSKPFYTNLMSCICRKST